MGKNAVEVRDIHKKFRYSGHKNNSLKRAITQIFHKKDTTTEEFYALDGISFNVEKGDFFGILGRNGSGKSTLLKIIAEIYQPTSGSVRHDGKVVSFIELGVGFKSELTGKENVYLNGGLLGFSKKEVDAMYDDIVEFAELEKFMDQQLKNYSSGMKVRLAFSVAIRSHADILILDEVLAVGDADFQRKCTDYFETLKTDGKTVILVTHTMGHVRRFCNKAVVIEEGEVIYNGEAEEAADTYLDLFKPDSVESENDEDENSVEVLAKTNIDSKNVHLSIELVPQQDIEDVMVAILINKRGGQVFRWVSDEDYKKSITLKNGQKLKINLDLQNIFATGLHTVDVLVKSRDRETIYSTCKHITEFTRLNTSQYIHRTLWQPKQSVSITAETSHE